MGIKFHAVMIDETGCEFGVSLEAESRDAAYEELEEDYPESKVDVLKTSDEWDEEQRERENRIYQGMWGDQDYPEDDVAYEEECRYYGW